MYTLIDSSNKYSGNKTTIKRLKKILQLDTSNDLSPYSIGINAYNFGTQINNMKDKCKDYIVILGGTDVYDSDIVQDKKDIIAQTLDHSKCIVSFNKDMKKRVLDDFQISEDKIHVIPQSISTKLKASQYDLYTILNIPKKKKIFLMVGNLRPVKRPDFLFEYFKKSKRNVLVIIGIMDHHQYTFPKNVYHINGLKKKDLYACMKQSIGLINCSINEGMSSAILEAMVLRCPVYAFKNPGNMALVKDNYNGYIFEDKKTFSFIRKLPTEHIIKNAFDYVSVNHSTRHERNAYLELMDTTLNLFT